MYWWQPFFDDDDRVEKAADSPCFKHMALVKDFIGDGAPVVNHSPESAYDTWPREGWTDVFE